MYEKHPCLVRVLCISIVSHVECMSESEVELLEESKSRRRRRRKRGTKKKTGFGIFSDQLISSSTIPGGGPVSSPASSFASDNTVIGERKMSCLELENFEDSMSTTLADTPPGMSQITPGSVVSSQSMWELGSYDEEVTEEPTTRPIIRSPMMMLASSESDHNSVDEIVAGIESVLVKIHSVAGTSFSRLCVPSEQRRLCVPSRPISDGGFFEVLERVKQSVSNSLDEILSKMNPPENVEQVLNGLESRRRQNEVEMTVPVLNRRQKRSILFGGGGKA